MKHKATITKNKTLFVIFISLVILLISLYVVYSTIFPKRFRDYDSANTSAIEWINYTNTKFNYSFTYPSNFIFYPTDESASRSALVNVYKLDPNNDNEKEIDVHVILVFKNPVKGYYDGRVYDPFTYEIENILSINVGTSSQTTNGSVFRRLPNEKLSDHDASVFEWYSTKRYVIDSKEYYYILSVRVISDSEANKLISSFKFL